MNFYADFDYSVFFDGAGSVSRRSSLNWCSSVFSLTEPAYRFGFDNTSGPAAGMDSLGNSSAHGLSAALHKKKRHTPVSTTRDAAMPIFPNPMSARNT